MTMRKAPMIRVEGLRKSYGQAIVLDIEGLDFHAKKIYALVGPNGAGKTTLFNILGLLQRPDAGKVFFRGRPLNGKAPLNTRRKIALLSQDPYLFHGTVFDNIAYGLKLRSKGKRAIEGKVHAALELVGLEGLACRKADQLSGGEVQRVALARALALEPEVLLLDEPTANIDQSNVNSFEELIKKIHSESNTTIIFTTHDLVQAYRLAEEIILLIDGRPVNKKPDNIFNARIREANGLKWAVINKDIKIAVVTEKKDRARVLVDPEDIILSRKPLDSSARNSFKGKISRVVALDQQVRVFVDAGIEFAVLITKRSFAKMKLNLGSKLYLTFKSSAVQVF